MAKHLIQPSYVCQSTGFSGIVTKSCDSWKNSSRKKLIRKYMFWRNFLINLVELGCKHPLTLSMWSPRLTLVPHSKKVMVIFLTNRNTAPGMKLTLPCVHPYPISRFQQLKMCLSLKGWALIFGRRICAGY